MDQQSLLVIMAAFVVISAIALCIQAGFLFAIFKAIRTMEARTAPLIPKLDALVDTSRAVVDIAVDDSDSSLLRAGSRAAIKLNSFPTRVFRGEVTIVSPRGVLQGDSRVFFARVALQNADGDVTKAQQGIIYIDEIDKISKKDENPSITRLRHRA